MRVVLWRLAAGVRRPPLVYVQSQRHSAALFGCRTLRHRSMAAPQSSADPAPALDRDAFTEVLRLQALRIPARDCQRFMRLMTGWDFDKIPLFVRQMSVWLRPLDLCTFNCCIGIKPSASKVLCAPLCSFLAPPMQR